MTETLTTRGLESFLDAMKSTQLDRFVRVMGHLQTEGATGALEQRLTKVIEELDKIDHHRNNMTDRQKDLRIVLEDLDTTILQEGDLPDLITLKLLLQQLDAELEEEIAVSRPVMLLAEKAKLRKEIRRRKLFARLVTSTVGERARERARLKRD